MKKTRWPSDRIREMEMDRKADELRERQKLAKTKATEPTPSALGEVLHDGTSEKRKLPYRQYLLTNHWRITRKKIIELSEHRCSACGADHRLVVHHLTYAHMWRECSNDLSVLCETCHNILHGMHVYA